MWVVLSVDFVSESSAADGHSLRRVPLGGWLVAMHWLSLTSSGDSPPLNDRGDGLRAKLDDSIMILSLLVLDPSLPCTHLFCDSTIC